MVTKHSVDLGAHTLPDGSWVRATAHIYDNRLRDMILRAWSNKHGKACTADGAFEVALEAVSAEDAMQPKVPEMRDTGDLVPEEED